MSEVDSAGAQPGLPAQWRDILALLEGNLRAAAESVALLRASLGDMPPSTASFPETALLPKVAPIRALSPAALPSQGALPTEKDHVAPDAFDRLWERLEHERLERSEVDGEPAPSQPLTLEERLAATLAQQYVITVEDHERQVDLVQLQRALLRVADMEDVSLVSFLNGVAVVSVRVKGEFNVEGLEQALSDALDADCEVATQENRVRVRLSERKKEAG